MEINIDYVIDLLARRYASNEEGAIYGDSCCIGVQTGCKLIINELAEDIPEYPVINVFNGAVETYMEAFHTEED